MSGAGVNDSKVTAMAGLTQSVAAAVDGPVGRGRLAAEAAGAGFETGGARKER